MRKQRPTWGQWSSGKMQPVGTWQQKQGSRMESAGCAERQAARCQTST